MASQEYAHDFGAITAAETAQFAMPDGYAPTTFKGSANVRSNAVIKYAIIRNSTNGAVVVRGGFGPSTVGIGERKRIEFPAHTRFFLVTPVATVSAGELTADVGIEGVIL